MKVVLLNTSDSRGGAAIVTVRLLEALRKEGIDASMLTLHRESSKEAIYAASSSVLANLPFYAEHAKIFAKNGFSRHSLFKISIASDGLPISKHPLIRQADIIVLNWINQGFISFNEIEKIASLGKKIVWTMHDMWNLTGICHHAGNCNNYISTNGCSHCKLLNSRASANDLSHKTWLRKQRLYETHNITFVAVSNWLANKCRISTLMQKSRVEVIPNAFPYEEFYYTPTKTRQEMLLPADGKLILMGAARLDDPIKGLKYAIEALNILAQRNDIPKATAVFFGDIKNPEAISKLKYPYIHLGTIKSTEYLRELYTNADIILSSSLYETLPGTLIEGISAGAFAVTFGEGGQGDIVEHLKNGYIAKYLDAEDLANGIAFGLTGILKTKEKDDINNSQHSLQTRSEQHKSMEHFNAQSIALEYINLFRKILK